MVSFAKSNPMIGDMISDGMSEQVRILAFQARGRRSIRRYGICTEELLFFGLVY